MKISVLTVTYNSERFLKEYLDSVFKFLPKNSEIIIVDSGSQDKTVEILKKYPNKFLLIESKDNINFGRGNNLAAEKAQGEYLFILNPDTKLSDDPFTPLLKFIESNEKVGIVAPKLIETDGKPQPSVRKLPSVIGAIKEYWFGIKNSYEAYCPKTEAAIEVECVVGAAMFIPKKLFDEIGGFNKKYTAYFEDLQLCKDVNQKGYIIYYLPGVKLVHAVGGSVNEMKQKWLIESAKKYHGEINYLLIYLIIRSHQIFKKVL